jgi:hypothetical protein
VVLRSATRIDASLGDVAPAPVGRGAPEGEEALEGADELDDEPLWLEDGLVPDEPLAFCPLVDFGVVETEGTETDGVDVDGTVPAGVLTDGVVTVGVLTGGVVTVGVVTGGVVTVGVVTGGVVTEGVVTGGVVTDGVVTAGACAEGTVTDGTVADGTVTDGTPPAGACCAPAGNPLIPSDATTNVAPNHRRRRVISSPSLRPESTLPGALRPKRAARIRARSRDLDVHERHPPEPDDVAVMQGRLGDAPPVDPGAVGAAVIEDARAGGALDDDRMATRDALVLEAQIG